MYKTDTNDAWLHLTVNADAKMHKLAYNLCILASALSIRYNFSNSKSPNMWNVGSFWNFCIGYKF